MVHSHTANQQAERRAADVARMFFGHGLLPDR